MSWNKPTWMVVVAGPTHNLSEELGAIVLENYPAAGEPKPVATIRT